MNGICLQIKDLALGYEGYTAVHHLTGNVEQGSLTVIVGANVQANRC